MTKHFIAIASACLALVSSFGAWAQLPDSKSGAQPPQQLVQRAKRAPIAFGFVSTDGSVQSGSGNFSASVKANVYHIKITDVKYYFSHFATIVTPSLPETAYCTTDSFKGELLVQCFDSTGTAVAAAFGFITF